MTNMADAFHDLTDADLDALAHAVRTGRLAAPYVASAIQGYCSAEVATRVAGVMQQLTTEGMHSAHLALLLETVAGTRSRQERTLLDLVWTGPEAPGTVNRDTSVVVRQLFESARDSVLVAGYAVHQGRDVFAPLAAKMAEHASLTVRLFLDVPRLIGDETPAEELLYRFAVRFRMYQWPGERLPEVFYDPRSLGLDMEKRSCLHAKCVVVDRECALISSANFTEAAQLRNIEAGVLIRSPHFAAQLADHFETLTAKGLLLRVPMRT